MRSMKSHTHFCSVFRSTAPPLPPTAEHLGASHGYIYLQKIQHPEQVLWLALVGEEAVLLYHVSHMEDDLHA
jgi:hypothetical protein